MRDARSELANRRNSSSSSSSDEALRRKLVTEFKKSRPPSLPSFQEAAPPPAQQTALAAKTNVETARTVDMKVIATASDDLVCCDTREVVARKDEDVLLVYPMVNDREGNVMMCMYTIDPETGQVETHRVVVYYKRPNGRTVTNFRLI